MTAEDPIVAVKFNGLEEIKAICNRISNLVNELEELSGKLAEAAITAEFDISPVIEGEQ